MACLFGALPSQAQVRPDIYSFTGGPGGQREQLFNLMLQYIDETVLQEHCNMVMISGGMIHSDFDFLPFHRSYLQGMEDFLIAQNHPEFVPLPKWDPSVPAPAEFQFGGPNGDGIDPDCASFFCDNGGPASACNETMNWAPGISRPSYLTLPVQPGGNNDLCDWPMLPTFPDPCDCYPAGLSRHIESPYHNSVHTTMGDGLPLGPNPPPAAPY